MKMRKKLLVLCLTLCLVVSGAVGIGGLRSRKIANASIVEKFVAEKLISAGIENERDWIKLGETAQDSFKVDIRGDMFAMNSDGSFFNGYFIPYKRYAVEDFDEIKVEFDLLESQILSLVPYTNTKHNNGTPAQLLSINSANTMNTTDIPIWQSSNTIRIGK